MSGVLAPLGRCLACGCKDSFLAQQGDGSLRNPIAFAFVIGLATAAHAGVHEQMLPLCREHSRDVQEILAKMGTRVAVLRVAHGAPS